MGVQTCQCLSLETYLHTYCMEARLHNAITQGSPPIIALFGFLAIRPAHAAVSMLGYFFLASA